MTDTKMRTQLENLLWSLAQDSAEGEDTFGMSWGWHVQPENERMEVEPGSGEFVTVPEGAYLMVLNSDGVLNLIVCEDEATLMEVVGQMNDTYAQWMSEVQS